MVVGSSVTSVDDFVMIRGLSDVNRDVMVSVNCPVDAVKLNVPVPLCGGTENGIVVVMTVWEVNVDRDLVV